MSARGTTNTNTRGSAADRRQRKRWLLLVFGDGEKAPCSHCRTELTFETITVDRIIPGCQGGTYRRGNIQPSCQRCNSIDGVRLRERIRNADSTQDSAAQDHGAEGRCYSTGTVTGGGRSEGLQEQGGRHGQALQGKR